MTLTLGWGKGTGGVPSPIAPHPFVVPWSPQQFPRRDASGVFHDGAGAASDTPVYSAPFPDVGGLDQGRDSSHEDAGTNLDVGARPDGESRLDAAVADAAFEGAPEVPDAGVADLSPPDGRTPDIATYDLVPDSVLAAFPEIPGSSFAIAAIATAADAGTSGGACRPSDRNATYALQFSADGQKVQIIRTDPVQEATMDGVFTKTAAGSLVYQIDNNWAGAQLIVRREGTALLAQLVVFGSGVPVVSCIDAPMTLARSGPG